MPHQKGIQSELYYRHKENDGIRFQRHGLPDLEVIVREIEAMPSKVTVEVRGCPEVTRFVLDNGNDRLKVDRIQVKLKRVDYSGVTYKAFISYRYPRVYYAKREHFSEVRKF